MLRDTTSLLANLTSYAAVVVGPPHEAATIRSVQLVGLGSEVAWSSWCSPTGSSTATRSTSTRTRARWS